MPLPRSLANLKREFSNAKKKMLATRPTPDSAANITAQAVNRIRTRLLPEPARDSPPDFTCSRRDTASRANTSSGLREGETANAGVPVQEPDPRIPLQELPAVEASRRPSGQPSWRKRRSTQDQSGQVSHQDSRTFRGRAMQQGDRGLPCDNARQQDGTAGPPVAAADEEAEWRCLKEVRRTYACCNSAPREY